MKNSFVNNCGYLGLRRRQRRGSALIITLLIIAVLSTISFAVSALVISELRKNSSLVDSISAYYAAESGIEQGLMQYRLWHDSEISQEIYNAVRNNTPVTNAMSPTEDTKKGKPQIFRLSDLRPSKNDRPGIVFSGDKGTTWYEMKMWYKGDHIGDVDSSGNPVLGPNSRKIFRDSALNLSIKDADKVLIKWQQSSDANGNRNPGPGHPYKFFVETISTNNVSGEIERAILDPIAQRQTYNAVVVGSDNTVRIKPWDMSYMTYSLSAKKDNQPVLFDTQLSYIEVSGHSGSSQRKLRIGINRSSGTILETQDFVIFSREKPIILP